MLEGEFRAGGIDPDEGRRQTAEAIPLGRVGTPEEIGKAGGPSRLRRRRTAR